jgi:hypothetical protein
MGAFLAGIILGVWCGAMMLEHTNSYHTMAKSAIAECEKKLPRDQVCGVIGVPKEIK